MLYLLHTIHSRSIDMYPQRFGSMITTLTYILLLSLSHASPLSLATTNSFKSVAYYQSAKSTCSVPGYKQCSNPLSNSTHEVPFPSDFCCPDSTDCLSSDKGSTLICCPKGHDCSRIEVTGCDINLQNATASPKSVVKTTRLDDDLPTCGDGCCPFGYECTKEGYCQLKNNAIPTSRNNGTAPSATDSPTTALPDPSTSGADASDGFSGGEHHEETKDEEFPGKAVGLGFGLGSLCGMMIALSLIACLQCFRRHRKPGAKDEDKEGALEKSEKSQEQHVDWKQKHLSHSEPAIPRHPWQKSNGSIGNRSGSGAQRPNSHNSTSSLFSGKQSASSKQRLSGPPSTVIVNGIPRRVSSINKGRSPTSGEISKAKQKHMGHELLFRPRDLGMSLSSDDVEAWKQRAAIRDDQNAGDRRRQGSGGCGTEGTTWTDVVDEASKRDV